MKIHPISPYLALTEREENDQLFVGSAYGEMWTYERIVPVPPKRESRWWYVGLGIALGLAWWLLYEFVVGVAR